MGFYWFLCYTKFKAITNTYTMFLIPGQGPEGHLVLDLENEVGHPVQRQKSMLISTKIAVSDEKVFLFIYV